MVSVRKGQAPGLMARDEFGKRFRQQFFDPTYRRHDGVIGELEAIAWEAYREGRKAPVTEKAGPEFADPDYALSVEWRETRDRIRAADARRRDPATRSRVLVVSSPIRRRRSSGRGRSDPPHAAS